MQAIMLAAGKGSRLGKYTKNNTKCMLEVNGIKLLDRAINALKKANIHKLILVLGYEKDNVKEYVDNNVKDMEIIYVDNDIYDKTNSIYSLFLARDYLLNDDTILLESDLIYDENLIANLINSKYESAAVVAKYEQWMDGTVTITDDDNNITNVIEKKDFEYSNIDKYYKTVNIYKFSKEFSEKLYVPFLESYIKAFGNNDYYELVLKVISNLNKSHLKAYKVSNELWYEIDDCQDLDIASTLFATENKVELYQKRYGGYWRFENMKDYCYLVNPYFPTESLKNKMKYFFDKLLIDYRSGLKIQGICASRLFDNTDENNLIVGNGAAELINNLRYVVKGKIGMFNPTFNEYVRCFPDNEIIKINSSDYNYQLDKDIIIKTLDNVDNFVIINPDNPSGSMIKYDDMIEILEYAKNKNKTIVYDESFIDFADKDIRYTLINDEILDKYPNLIVIKSISKSYGVPGLRLGVLATSNIDNKKIIKENMPVWNINSFAEYFLQIILLYKKDYVLACDKIAEERNRFYNELSKINNITVYKSQANYFMIELKNIKAIELTDRLLKHNIFIKVLNGKSGFEKGEYIRIAIKDTKDNNELLELLKDYC